MATILLVDDDVDMVEMYRVVLDHRGHTVWPAYSAADASKVLDKGVPDIVVLDVMMESDTAGFNLAREIHERHPALPVVMLSGIHSVTGVPWRFEPDETWLPVLKFMDKPVQPAALAQEIERLLRG